MSRRRKDGSVHRVNGGLLDVESASASYGPTPSAFRHLVERRAIPFLKLRGRIYFRRASLDSYFAKLERQSSGSEAA